MLEEQQKFLNDNAFSCQVYPNLSIEETIIQQHIEQTSRHLVYKFDKLFIRHWDEYMLGKCHHRFIASIARNSQWSFNDNGNSFAFTRQHDETSQVVWSTNLDIPPVAFLIHGGSQNSWYNTWGRGWSFQAFAAQGYAVIAINFHGSDSYGQNFTDSITGASYGGFMINWIAGHPEMSQRFRALVCHDGLFDMREMGYATEELWFSEHDVGGFTPYENPQAYEKFNPINHVAN
ncbi:unnamed protein product [Rotaria socialis]|uniref:Peptidase S9 prolyl oligopeptidase catalytic domain-containing protein n=1 Tax=Rotaria socialis TaxID=392032 RepID=A0A817L869_9BILA|nr:unnamed protein product [Rotaria socialis]